MILEKTNIFLVYINIDKAANRSALIHRVNAVKRAQTRERKISEFVAMLARHETINPQRARPAEPPTS